MTATTDGSTGQPPQEGAAAGVTPAVRDRCSGGVGGGGVCERPLLVCRSHHWRPHGRRRGGLPQPPIPPPPHSSLGAASPADAGAPTANANTEVRSQRACRCLTWNAGRVPPSGRCVRGAAGCARGQKLPLPAGRPSRGYPRGGGGAGGRRGRATRAVSSAPTAPGVAPPPLGDTSTTSRTPSPCRGHRPRAQLIR